VDSLSLDDYADVNDIDDNNDDNDDDTGDITTITAQVKSVLMFSGANGDKGQLQTGSPTGQITVLKAVFKATVILQNSMCSAGSFNPGRIQMKRDGTW
jgi:hypothetical protein